MDAWETLLTTSTLSIGDAWEHLNAQGGSGPSVPGGFVPGVYTVQYVGELEQLATYIHAPKSLVTLAAQSISSVTYVTNKKVSIEYLDTETEVKITCR